MKLAFGVNSGSGKDTSVDYLINKYGGQKYSFATPLYDMMYTSQKILHLPQTKNRKFLQMFGDFFKNEINEDVFIDLCLKKISVAAASVDGQHCYISDLRFHREFQKLKDNGFTCIKINRRCDNTTRIDNGNKSHISETSLNGKADDEWDFIVDNNGSLEDLYNQLDMIVFAKI